MTLMAVLPLILTGLFAGFAGGLFGIGGGVIIVPALYATFLAGGMPEILAIKSAIATSMGTIIVTSIRSVMRHNRHQNVEWPILKTWAPAMAIGAVFGALLARNVDGQVLTGIFGAGLIALAIQRYLKSGRERTAPSGQLPAPLVQRGMATGVGAASSLLGIGGGIIGVFLLTRAGRTVHRAVGTAAGFGLIIAVPGTFGYLLPTESAAIGNFFLIGYVSVPAFLAVSLGTFFAAPFGASTAAKLSETLLTRIFATYAAITGVLMLLESIRGA